MKICNRCKEKKDYSEFYPSKDSKDGLNYMCKVCRKKDANAWNAANKEKIRLRDKDYNKQRRLKRHNISQEKFNEILEKQLNRCPICLNLLNIKVAKSISIDHDHKCCPGSYSCGLCIRGLLCNSCNLAIGQLKDDPEYLKRAIIYLDKPNN